MKPTLNSPSELPPLLAFGAHPDDLEFGCGGIIAQETRHGRRVHFVVCSRGEAASHGTPAVRKGEAEKSAALLGATIEFVQLDGDARLEVKPAHALTLAGLIRKHEPGLILAPTAVGNQHPDHSRLSILVRDAARLARYGGIEGLEPRKAHAVQHLLYYAVTVEGEPTGEAPLMVDVSDPEILKLWTAAMEAHSSQAATRNYVELQLTRARLFGLRAGVTHAMAVWPNDPLLFSSLTSLEGSARRF
jgi:LmbE family N-acetylglucosaminyl deacetylase